MKEDGPIRSAIRFIPTAITLAALCSGLLSLYASIHGLETGDRSMLATAALLIMLAMILDGLDGNVARLLKAESAIGGELDTFVDLTAFGIAPALLIYAGAQDIPAFARILLGCILVASGAYRLARFKVIDPLHGQHGFTGIPITACAAVTATLTLLADRAPDSWGPLKIALWSGPTGVAFLVVVLILAGLQVSRLHYPKPTLHPLFFGAAIVLVILLFSGSAPLTAGSALIINLFGLYYIFLSPFLKLKG